MIGREQELAAACAVLDGGMHLLLEGPVGSGKTTLAAEACRRLGRQTIRIDGDDRFTESRLAGWFDPPLVLRLGYGEDAFVPGPLVLAMREGRVLFLNELNRLPEAAQNLLLPALDEGVVQVPHLGEVRAADGFQVVATQNPAEYVATGHLSEALRDRFEHLVVDYQTAAEEEAIVAAGDGVRGCGRWCARPSAWCGPREYTRACAAARPCAARWRSWTWPARRMGGALGARCARRRRPRWRRAWSCATATPSSATCSTSSWSWWSSAGRTRTWWPQPGGVSPPRAGVRGERPRAIVTSAAAREERRRSAGRSRSSARWRTAARWRSSCARRPRISTAGSSPAT